MISRTYREWIVWAAVWALVWGSGVALALSFERCPGWMFALKLSLAFCLSAAAMAWYVPLKELRALKRGFTFDSALGISNYAGSEKAVKAAARRFGELRLRFVVSIAMGIVFFGSVVSMSL